MSLETDGRKVLIVGASRGIGKALAAQFVNAGDRVDATVRADSANGELAEDSVRYHRMDMLDQDAGIALSGQFEEGELDVLVLNAGVIGPSHQDATLMNPEEMHDLFWVNVIAPIRVARRLISKVRPGGVVAFLSSAMGSIELNDDGGKELYRASKTALNSLTRSFVNKDAIPRGVGVRSLHPGWVKTEMGGEDAPVTIDDSVSGLHTVIKDAIGRKDHRFLDYQGEELPW